MAWPAKKFPGDNRLEVVEEKNTPPVGEEDGIVKNGSLSDLAYFFTNFSLNFCRRSANKTRAKKINELTSYGATGYILFERIGNEPTREILRLRQENKQRLRSRGIKAVYIEMSFRSNYLKRRPPTGFSLIY